MKRFRVYSCLSPLREYRIPAAAAEKYCSVSTQARALAEETNVQRTQQGGIVLARLDDVVRWAERSSLWPLMMGLACCAIEMMATAASRYDIARFGAELFRPSPRQADLMIVSGRLCLKMIPVARRLYDQMPEPKWVVSMGACASTSGLFSNYAVLNGVDKMLPVDVYIPGCPPSPDMLLQALVRLQDKIRSGEAPGREV